MRASSILVSGAVAAVAVAGSVNAAVVTFGTPDHLALGLVCPSATSTLSWEYSPGQPARAGLSFAWTLVDASSGSTANIVAEPNGVAIKTKGTGADKNRIAFSPPAGTVSPFPVAVSHVKKSKSNISSNRTVEIDVIVGADNGVDNNLLRLFIDVTSPRGWLFASTDDPVVTISPDFTYVDISSNLFPPLGDTSDPSLPDVTFTLTATAMPAPGAIALLGMAGLAGRRRRR